jgi:hypothetical protein
MQSKGEHAVGRVALRIHGEGDAEVAQLRVGVRGAPLQLVQRQGRQRSRTCWVAPPRDISHQNAPGS